MGALANCRYLANNQLTGTLPEEWNTMTNITFLCVPLNEIACWMLSMNLGADVCCAPA
jgi:hypothetical protein